MGVRSASPAGTSMAQPSAPRANSSGLLATWSSPTGRQQQLNSPTISWKLQVQAVGMLSVIRGSTAVANSVSVPPSEWPAQPIRRGSTSGRVSR